MQTISPKGNVVGPILPLYVLARPISAGAKILYAILCNYASVKDHCWPSQETLAKRVGCSISSVKNYLRELIGESLISVQREHSHSSIYYILRPSEFDAQSNITCEQPNLDCHESNSGYINNLKISA